MRDSETNTKRQREEEEVVGGAMWRYNKYRGWREKRVWGEKRGRERERNI